MTFGKLPMALAFTALIAVAVPNAEAEDWIIFAKQGDTLWDLCLKYTNKRGCWIELGKYNAISNDRAIPLGTEIRIPAAWLTSQPRVGTVLAVSGDVDYFQVGSAEAVTLQRGQALHLGSRLVSKGGSARIELGAGRELLMRPNTTIELNTMSGPAGLRHAADLDMPEGDVEATIKAQGRSRFRISTPAAIAAVRGTQYRVNSRPDSMRSEVLTGAVEVAAGQAAQLVPAGFGLAARKGAEPGQPRKLLAAPVFARSYAAVNTPATIEWNANPAAASWVLDVLEDRVGGALLQSHSTPRPNYTLESLKEGCYQVELRAVDSDGFNGLPSSSKLCIVPRLATVSGLSKITVNPSTGAMQLSWHPVMGAHSYRAEVSTDSSFSEIIETRNTSTTDMEFAQPADSPYSVRVIALDAAGNESPPSTPVDFEPEADMPWGFFMLLFAIMVSLA